MKNFVKYLLIFIIGIGLLGCTESSDDAETVLSDELQALKILNGANMQ